MVVLLTAILTLCDAVLTTHDRAKEAEDRRDEVRAEYESYKAESGLPKVVEGREAFSELDAELVCLLRPSKLFSHDIAVSFFRVDVQGGEELVGVGRIVNIQENGIIQAAMIRPLQGHEDFAKRLRQNEGEAVRTTRVKPNVPGSHTNL